MSLVRLESPDSITNHSIVFDLDETLVHTFPNSVGEDEKKVLALSRDLGIYTDPNLLDIRDRSYRVPLDDPTKTRGTGEKFACWGITRPHFEEFMVFAFSYFKTVNIWSAGARSYVEETTSFLERRKLPGEFKVVYTRDQCVKQNGNHYKPLEKMLQEHPEIGTLNNTFIVDDRADTFSYNPQNGILIPVYRPEATVNSLRTDDDNLLRLKYWLLNPKVKAATDIRELNKSSIFRYSVAEYLQGGGDF